MNPKSLIKFNVFVGGQKVGHLIRATYADAYADAVRVWGSDVEVETACWI
jgi:hypothetical protein